MSTLALANEKPLDWPNLTAPMDVRSNPNDVGWGRWRWALNVRSPEKGQLMRREGWRRFGYQTEHPNCDLHDQHGTTHPIRSIHYHPGNGVAPRLFCGTATDVWMNRADGGWRSTLTVPEGGRWSFASLSDLVLAANGKVVRYMRVGAPGSMVEIQSLSKPAPDGVGVTGAHVAWTFQGTFFLADVVIDGVRVRNLIVWANQNSIEFVPSADSTAGFYHLNPDEQILAGMWVGTVFMVFTTRGAWRLGVQDGQFVFQNVYYSANRSACPLNGAAIAVDRGVAFYMASDGIYSMSPFSQAPEWSDWINDGLPRSFIAEEDGDCLVEAAIYDQTRNEVWFSSPTAGLTFIIDLRRSSTSVMDHAWTALEPAVLRRVDDVAMWWVRSGICSADAVDDFFPLGEREDARQHPPVTGEATGCSPFNPPCPACTSSIELVGASADDFCLKFIDPTFFSREMRGSDGEWSLRAYGSRLVTGCPNFGTQDEKRVSRAIVEFVAGGDTIAKASLRVGVSASPVDPLVEGCRKVWTFREKELRCTTPRPGDAPRFQPAQWIFVADGRYLYFDLRIDDTSGASVTFTRFAIAVSRSPNSTP